MISNETSSEMSNSEIDTLTNIETPEGESPISGKSVKSVIVEPFIYHKNLRDHYKSRKKTWKWFSEETNKAQQVNDFKSTLLKNTYRLDRESHETLYRISDEICTALAIDAEVTIYQENNSVQLNAGISIIDKEAHIVLSGNLLNLLSDDELKALLGHELSHYLFYKIDNEEFEITQRLVLALANDQRSENAVIETARIFQLYMELFCDLGSLKVCNDYRIVIQALVKINTGLSHVNADSYVKQAEEILNADVESTKNESHPEAYIRSIALKLHAEDSKGYLKQLKRMIEGPLDLNCLDIFEQVKLQDITKDLLQCIVTPNWMNSSAVLNLCKSYFEKFYKSTKHKSLSDLAKELDNTKDSIKNYLSYVLLDFAKIDPNLEAAPLGFTLEIAELLTIKNFYEKLLRKELKLTVRDFKLLKTKAMAELQQVKESKDESLYSE
jgi:hypothetical protein